MNGVLETLVEIVDIPSVTADEDRLCTYVTRRLSDGPRPVRRLGNSVVVGAPTGRPQITLYGHLDTVPPQGQGPARVEDGKLYGLGTTDMKAGVAVMLHLLEDPAVQAGPFDVVGVFYDREEGRMDENGLEPVLEQVEWLTGAELAVVLEPTDLAIELGCQGVMNARAVFTGTAAHSARPWLGRNAVTRAGEWLARLGGIAPHPVLVEGLEYIEVVTVTTAHGGVARNIVPDRFEVNVNYRFPPTLTLDEARDRFLELIAGPDEIEIIDSAPAGPVAAAHPQVARLAAVAGAGFQPKQAWTDVARLAGRGIPAVNYGPGIPALAHTRDEYVPVESVTRAYDIMRRFLTED